MSRGMFARFDSLLRTFETRDLGFSLKGNAPFADVGCTVLRKACRPGYRVKNSRSW